jgi:small conductance mechanosensitive channel
MFESLTLLRAHSVQFAMNLALALAIVVGFGVVAAVIGNVLVRLSKRAGEGREDVLLLSAQVAKAAILTFGIITGLGTVGVNVSALVAGLGLTGFALGFAFRDALSNVLAGAMILFYHPFRRQDHIAVSGFEGTVIEINLRYTVIQSPNVRILVPNSNLLTHPIVVRQATQEDSVLITSTEKK